jgi:hypothetical protein
MREFTDNALPARIVFGSGAARTRLAPEIERSGARRVLLVASERERSAVTGNGADGGMAVSEQEKRERALTDGAVGSSVKFDIVLEPIS